MFSIFLFFFILIIVASVRRLHHPVLASYIFRSPFLVSKWLYFFRIPKERDFFINDDFWYFFGISVINILMKHTV